MKNKTVSPRSVLTTVVVLVASLGVVEWRALYALDHPPLHRTDCFTCHSDAKTVQAMADKAGDDRYYRPHDFGRKAASGVLR